MAPRKNRSSGRQADITKTESDSPKKASAKAKHAPPQKKEKPKKNESSIPDGEKKIVSVEACKQWGAFKTRANKIAQAVGDKAVVEINKQKPGRGNFIIRVSGVEQPIVELKGMSRPFPALKKLDMDQVSQQVLDTIEAN